ncbi:MAG: ribosomal protein [Alphaproteobacteria bacterium]|jgi:large subunit ribosomal protein L9|nr:ribosomal protein [Alphaproteobacteria bacterium]
MQVILLERVESLGQMGEVVNVKPGYARNFLLPQSKALRATKDNVALFEAQKKTLEADNLKRRDEAEKIGKKVDGIHAAIIRQASEAGQLYGSVTARDIAESIAEQGFKVDRAQVRMERAYKLLGLYPVKVQLHPEVTVSVTINIARSKEEAKIQEERGEALIQKADNDRDDTLSAKAIKAIEAQEKAAAAAAAAEAEAGEQPAEEAAA